MLLHENSLYTNQLEKEELLKDRKKLASALLFNYFGFISLFAAQPKADVKNWKNKNDKVQLRSITDENTDVSLVLKLVHEANMLPENTLNMMTKLLALFKQGKITKKQDVVDDRIHELFLKCKFDGVNKPNSELLDIVNSYITRETNIAFLARELYRKSRLPKFLVVDQEFREMFKKGAYTQVYNNLENGLQKIEMGVPQKFIKKITDKTIIHSSTLQVSDNNNNDNDNGSDDISKVVDNTLNQDNINNVEKTVLDSINVEDNSTDKKENIDDNSEVDNGIDTILSALADVDLSKVEFDADILKDYSIVDAKDTYISKDYNTSLTGDNGEIYYKYVPYVSEIGHIKDSLLKSNEYSDFIYDITNKDIINLSDIFTQYVKFITPIVGEVVRLNDLKEIFEETIIDVIGVDFKNIVGDTKESYLDTLYNVFALLAKLAINPEKYFDFDFLHVNLSDYFMNDLDDLYMNKEIRKVLHEVYSNVPIRVPLDIVVKYGLSKNIFIENKLNPVNVVKVLENFYKTVTLINYLENRVKYKHISQISSKYNFIDAAIKCINIGYYNILDHAEANEFLKDKLDRFVREDLDMSKFINGSN